MTNTPTMPWADRTVGTGHMSPEDLMKAANPLNPRIHPDYQAEAVEGLLDQVGFVKRVIVNQTTGRVIDGHLRIKLALAKGAPTIPVEYVELSEAEERLVLATLDPTAALAEFDAEALAKLAEVVSLDFEEFDLSALFGEGEFEKMISRVPLNLEYGQSAAEEGSFQQPGSSNAQGYDGEREFEPSHVRQVQLFFDTENYGDFMEKVGILKNAYGADNITDAVYEGVNRAVIALGR